MLHWQFLDGGVDGFVNLCADIVWEITDKLEETKLYNNWEKLCRTYLVVGQISNAEYKECCCGDF